MANRPHYGGKVHLIDNDEQELDFTSDGKMRVEATGPLTNAELRAAPVPVSAGSLPLPSGAATAAGQSALLAEMEKKADLTEEQPVHLKTHEFMQDLTGLNDHISVYCADCSAGTIVFQVSGTWKGKIIVEGAVDGLYNTLSIVQPGGAISFTGVNNDNQNGVYRVLIVAGYTKVRIRMSEYTSGAANVIANTAQLVPTTFAWQLNPANLQTTATLSTASAAIFTGGTQATKLVDELGTPYGVKHVNNKPRVSAMPYTYDIAEGNVANHEPWSKIGYTPTLTTTESDLWSLAGVINFPASAMQMEVVSSNAADTGTVIFSGTATGGSTTTLIDATKDFTAGTPVEVGDCILLDSLGEFGFVSAVASTTLTVAGGFSLGGSASGATYRVVDKSASVGAQAVKVCYLDGNYASACEFVVLNGATAVPTTATNMYRINAFRVIAAGANNVPSGNLSVRNLADTPVYSYINAGFTRARNSAYTVPAGKALFVTEFTVGYGYSTNQTHYARIYTRATQFADGNTMFKTGGIFYPYTEVVCANTSEHVTLDVPTRLVAGVDIKVSGIATFAGTASIALRGWLENA